VHQINIKFIQYFVFKLQPFQNKAKGIQGLENEVLLLKGITISLRYYQGIQERTYQEEFYNARINLGVKFDFFGKK
jgi:hypothetical protein